MSPDAIALICIDCVNPHGKKNDAIPSSIGVNILFILSVFSTPDVNSLGIVNCNLLKNGDISSRFIERMSIIRKRIVVIMK